MEASILTQQKRYKLLFRVYPKSRFNELALPKEATASDKKDDEKFRKAISTYVCCLQSVRIAASLNRHNFGIKRTVTETTVVGHNAMAVVTRSFKIADAKEDVLNKM